MMGMVATWTVGVKVDAREVSGRSRFVSGPPGVLSISGSDEIGRQTGGGLVFLTNAQRLGDLAIG